jgi:hypothetical protein
MQENGFKNTMQGHWVLRPNRSRGWSINETRKPLFPDDRYGRYLKRVHKYLDDLSCSYSGFLDQIACILLWIIFQGIQI